MPPSSRLSRAWVADLSDRARHLFWLKFLGTTAFTWVFFVAYFALLRHPAHAVAEMPLTALDRWIPFEPAALVAYVSLWLYVGVAPGLQRTFRELVGYGAWAAALCTSGLLVFYFWPTRVPPRPLGDVSFPGFAILQGVDAAGNACPSMHVAIAMFSVLWVDRIFRVAAAPSALRAVNATWFALIVWSTVAVRQHVVLDVVAGALLGGAFAAASLHGRFGLPRTGRADMIRRSPPIFRPASGDGAEQETSPGVAP